MSKVLIADDNPDIRKLIIDALGEEHQYQEAPDGSSTLKIIATEKPDLIFLDLKMPDVTGMEILSRFQSDGLDAPIIVITAHGSVDVAVEAMKLGAYDFIAKPFDPETVRVTARNALASRALKLEVESLRTKLSEQYRFEKIVGQSPKMKEVFALMHKVLDNDVTVLIEGESGTGKELVAQAIHYNGKRKQGPFMVVNCSAIPETLIEAELFGYERGAFTGALERKTGRFERADGGTIFLDEVADIPPAVQVKLLRVLQERNFERLGGEEKIEVDVRVIASTNRNLKTQVESGTFREDLYYRLAVFPLRLPPLRERKEDIPYLAYHFINLYAGKIPKKVNAASPDAMERLINYAWPGNVRELENVIERAVVLSSGREITLRHLPTFLKDSAEEKDPVKSLQEAEKELLLKAYRAAEGNISQAARALGITRATFYNKLKRYKLDLP